MKGRGNARSKIVQVHCRIAPLVRLLDVIQAAVGSQRHIKHLGWHLRQLTRRAEQREVIKPQQNTAIQWELGRTEPKNTQQTTILVQFTHGSKIMGFSPLKKQTQNLATIKKRILKE